MGLETGAFIPDLVDVNPGGTDPKNEGDDHLRLIKTCVQGSFPAFVGTQAVPASVSLTEAQLNDAAIKSDPAIIDAVWLHNADLRLGNTFELQALDSGAVARRVAGLTAADLMQFGDGLVDAEHRALARSDIVVSATAAAAWVPPDSGSLLLRDRNNVQLKAGFRNPKTIVQSADLTVDQDAEGVVFRVTGANLQFTMAELEIGTSMRILCTAGSTQILRGALNLLRFMDGDNGMTEEPTGLQMQIGSVAELYFADVVTTVYVFGTGLTSI